MLGKRVRRWLKGALLDTSFFWPPDFYFLAASLICGRLFTKGESGTLGLAQFHSAIDIGLENTKWPIVTIKRAMESVNETAELVVY